MKHQLKYITTFPDPQNFASTKEEWFSEHGVSNTLIDCTSKNIYYPLHWTSLSMKFCFSGTEFYQSKRGIKYAVDDSCFLVFNEDKEYESFIQSPSDVNSVSVNFSASFVKLASQALAAHPQPIINQGNSDPSPDHIPVFFEQLYHSNQLLLDILNQLKVCSQFSEGNTNRIEELVFALFEQLMVSQRQVISNIKDIEKAKHTTRVEIFKRLQLAKDYIYSCYNNDIQLETLSNITLLNQYYLLRLFKSHFGTTPHKFLTQRRIEVAKKLLMQGNSVTDSCQKVGFTDLSSFGKLFKKNTGYSPTDFSALV